MRKPQEVNSPIKTLARTTEQKPLQASPALRKQLDNVMATPIVDIREAEERKACAMLITNVFRIIGMNMEDYADCFNASVEKAMSTQVLQATTWSNWGGYKDLDVQMNIIASLCKSTGRYHCPPATAIVCAIALLKLKGVVITDNSELSKSLRQCKTFDLAQTAIYYYEKFPDQIISLDEPITGEIDIVPQTPENENDTIAQHGEVSPTVRAHRASKANRALLLYKLKQMELNTAAATTLNDIDTYKVQVTHTITRKQAQQDLGELIRALQNGEMPSLSMANSVTLEKLKVLTRAEKSFILLWAMNGKLNQIMSWRDSVLANLEEFSWIEEKTKQMPETWSNHPAYTVWKEVEKWAIENPTNPIIPHLTQLKVIFEDQDKCGVDAQIHQRMDDMFREIDNIKGLVKGNSAELDQKMKKVNKQVAESASAVTEKMKEFEDPLNYTCGLMTEGVASSQENDGFDGFDGFDWFGEFDGFNGFDWFDLFDESDESPATKKNKNVESGNHYSGWRERQPLKTVFNEFNGFDKSPAITQNKIVFGHGGWRERQRLKTMFNEFNEFDTR
ncbi:hypothetical protein ACHAQJ_001947 [Trichoderma viride]